ncbi:RHS repeat-associated core domain-containing protein, partial [Salegentibacter salinarum]|uniref:RHS repeat domain-containing protein n=1 Tax=Salegentibacter salinarum TaxID=447422 RepID=UPI0009C81075
DISIYRVGSSVSGLKFSTGNNKDFLQEIDYAYNIRGWLKQINDPENLGDDLFGFGINYNDPTGGAPPLYNGNISETHWNTQSENISGNPVSNSYGYSYDALNRITGATDNTGNYNLSGIAYDKMGNILSLQRQGQTDAGATLFGTMDNLDYDYDGNRLMKVSDSGEKTWGFKEPTTSTGNDYGYDVNGNLTSDLNKGITAITYNYLNLPVDVEFNGSSSQKIHYTYDATGVKLRKEIPGKTTDYAGNFVYEDLSGTMELQFFSTPEGYVSYDGGQFNYVYNYVDHLGNVRLSYTDGNGDGSIDPATEIIQEKNYYPFGLTHQGYNGGGGGSAYGNTVAKRYGFGGKELQDETFSGNTLDWYDITARNYDPALGRWMNIDPLAELMRRHSPYNFAFDNPIFFIDPDGMIPFGNDDDPPTVYSGSSVAVGNNVNNQLDEVVITVNGNGTVATGTAQGAHFVTTETGKRFNGYKAEGQVEGDNGKVNGSVSGFSAGYDGYTESGGAHGSASVYGVSADGSARLGSKDNNVAIQGEGSAFKAEVSGDATLSGEGGKYVAELGGEAGVYALEGNVTPSLSIGGIQIGFTIGGSVGSAHIGGRVAGATNTEAREFEVTGNYHIGLGAGLKLGFSLSNTSQEVNPRRR